jgi:HEAT repeat protein
MHRWLVLTCLGLLAAVPVPSALAQEKDPLAPLLKDLESKKKEVRLKAAMKLGTYGTAAKTAVASLAKTMDDADNNVAAHAAASLAKIGRAGLPVLIAALKDVKPTVRHNVLRALALYGPSGRDAVPALLDMLNAESAAERGLAAQALGHIGGDAEQLVPPLGMLFLDANLFSRSSAGWALLKLGSPGIQAVGNALTADDAALRRDAAKLFKNVGKKGNEAIPALVNLLKDPDVETRIAAAVALGNMRSAGEAALTPLLEMLRDEKNLKGQQAAFEAVNSIGAKDLPKLLQAAREINEQGNWATPYLLQQFGPKAADAVPHLIKALGDKDQGIRLGAALALGELGPVAAPAAAALMKSLQDPNPQVRAGASAALASLDPRQQNFAQKQFVASLEQSHKSLSALKEQLRERREKRIAAAAKGARLPLDRQAFLDPVVQKEYNQLLELHLFLSSCRPASRIYMNGVGNGQLKKLKDQVYVTVPELGTDAVPALVRALNQAAQFNLGFC